MTEQEWLTCTDPEPMLLFLPRYTTRRKELLFALACCRRLPVLTDYCRQTLLALERSLDVPLSVDELKTLTNDALGYADDLSYHMGTPEGCARWLAACAVFDAAELNPPSASLHAAWAIEMTHEDPANFDIAVPGPPSKGDPAERRVQAGLLRCIVGNPFRPVVPDPAWLTRTTRSLAQAVYDSHTEAAGTLDSDCLAVLADALEEAGCTGEILAHCRTTSEHVRGCWVIDALLGRS